MGKIREYTNTQGIDTGPLSTQARAVQEAGYYSGQSYRQGVDALRTGVQEVEQHVAQNEITKLSADMATAQAELSTQWNELASSADPNDHELAANFLEKVAKPRIAKIGEGLLTEQAQQMFTKASAGLNADLFVKTTADQSQLAGQAAILNLDTVKNQLSTAVRNDPTSFKGALNMVDLTTEGLVKAYNLPRGKAMEMSHEIKSELAKSALIGMADANPAAAKDALARGDFNDYIDGTTAKTMESYADSQEKAGAEQERAAAAEQRRQEKDAADNVATAISTSMINPDTGDLQVPADAPKNIVRYGMMPGADPGQVRAMMNMVKTINNDAEKGKRAITDPNTYSTFSSRMFLGASDPNQLSLKEIYQARADGHLSDRDFAFFYKAANDAVKNPQKTAEQKDFQEFLKSNKSYLTKSSYIKTDAYGDQRYYEFQHDGQMLFDKLRNDGKSVEEAKAAVKATLPRYQITKGQSLDAIRQKAQGTLQPLPPIKNAPARNQGESAADYLKRTGG